MADFHHLDDYDDIKDYLDLEALQEPIDESSFPEFRADYSSSIVVDNIPVVPQEKIPKLLSVLVKIYAKIAKVSESDIYMPFNEEAKTTYGFCFIKFSSAEDAENAIKVTQGFAIDKRHHFKINLYSDLYKYEKLSHEYEPKLPPFNPRPDPTSWLTDEKCRDQFVVRHNRETEVFWASTVAGEDPSLVYGGEREKEGGKVWCESYVAWSPQGTYLSTFHPQGIKLWGGSDFNPHGKFLHPNVEELSFSPCENYVTTYRYSYHAALNPAEAIIVWDVRSNTPLRSFELKNPLDVRFQVQATVSEDDKKGKRIERVIRGRVVSYEGDSHGGSFTIEEGKTEHRDVPSEKVTPMQEPNRFKWSADGKYIARLGCDIISVYSLPSMALLDRKSIAAKDVLDFVWSPKSNLISYWSPAADNHPAQINIINIPEREDICSRKLFDVTDGRMVWQNDGDYLCVYMTKNQGKKKSYVLMFFRVKDPGVPVEQLELAEPILNVSWEPSGDRIVIMHGEARSPTVAFYSISGPVPTKTGGAATSNNKSNTVVIKKELTHLFSKSGVQCNEVSWSPAGGVVALAYFAPDACIFDLLDVENNVTLATRRHDRCTRLYWDPSGRYVASCTISDLRNSSTRAVAGDGFNVYTFQGTLLAQVKKDKLFQFMWRPRPKDLLSPEQRKKIIKNLRKYEKAFEREDRLRKQELNQEAQEIRYKQAEEFLSWLNANRATNAGLKARRVALRSGYDSDDDRNYKVEVVTEETVLKTSEQVVH